VGFNEFLDKTEIALAIIGIVLVFPPIYTYKFVKFLLT